MGMRVKSKVTEYEKLGSYQSHTSTPLAQELNPQRLPVHVLERWKGNKLNVMPNQLSLRDHLPQRVESKSRSEEDSLE